MAAPDGAGWYVGNDERAARHERHLVEFEGLQIAPRVSVTGAWNQTGPSTEVLHGIRRKGRAHSPVRHMAGILR